MSLFSPQGSYLNPGQGAFLNNLHSTEPLTGLTVPEHEPGCLGDPWYLAYSGPLAGGSQVLVIFRVESALSQRDFSGTSHPKEEGQSKKIQVECPGEHLLDVSSLWAGTTSDSFRGPEPVQAPRRSLW